MQFMVIERFVNSDPRPIYARLIEKGRMMPEGLLYINSWISEDFSTCWQVMEADDPAKFDEWTRNWDDLVDFEIVPVMTSAEAKSRSEAAG
ncbi:MAG: DUF3303 family protein [Armatimonadota bacterium]